VDIQIGIGSEQIGEHLYEVVVTATVTTKIKEQTMFLVEAKQAGIFEIRNIPQDQMNPVLSVACPQIIYPYLRGNVADLVQRAGFPPVHLNEINFESMYQQNLAQNDSTPVQ
jgi:preprotein translocase subunit SecB